MKCKTFHDLEIFLLQGVISIDISGLQIQLLICILESKETEAEIVVIPLLSKYLLNVFFLLGSRD
jgi:hypothetical protein